MNNEDGPIDATIAGRIAREMIAARTTSTTRTIRVRDAHERLAEAVTDLLHACGGAGARFSDTVADALALGVRHWVGERNSAVTIEIVYDLPGVPPPEPEPEPSST